MRALFLCGVLVLAGCGGDAGGVADAGVDDRGSTCPSGQIEETGRTVRCCLADEPDPHIACNQGFRWLRSDCREDDGERYYQCFTTCDAGACPDAK